MATRDERSLIQIKKVSKNAAWGPGKLQEGRQIGVGGAGRVKIDCQLWAQDSAFRSLECEGGSLMVGSSKDVITRGSVAKVSFLLRGKVNKVSTRNIAARGQRLSN